MSENENEVTPRSIDVEEAVSIAGEYLQGLYKNLAMDIRLEEVELNEGRSQWHVTLSFIPAKHVNEKTLESLSKVFGGDFEGSRRQYKELIIDSTTGRPKAMKIRKL